MAIFWACVINIPICQGGSCVSLCLNQNCPSKCAKVYHMFEEIRQGEASMGKGMCGF